MRAQPHADAGHPHSGRARRMHRAGLVALTAGLGLAALSGTVDADEATGRWERTPSLDSCDDPSCHARARHVAATLPEQGEVLAVGGEPNAGTAQRYDPAGAADSGDPTDAKWTPAAAPVDSVKHTDVERIAANVRLATDDLRVLIDEQLYDAVGDAWESEASGLQVEARTQLEPEGRLLGTGGFTYADTYEKGAAVYDPANRSVSSVADMIHGRHKHAAARIKQGDHAGVHAGKVLVAGGERGTRFYESQATAEIYDPEAGWTPAASMLVPRERHRTVALHDGRVMVLGGQFCRPAGRRQASCSKPLPSAEIYHPAAGVWVPTLPPVDVAVPTPPAVVLNDGRVLVIGEDDTGDTAAALFNPADLSWTRTPNLVKADRDPATATATLIDGPDSECGKLCGAVLLTGGEDSSGGAMASAEVFLPD